MAVDQERLDAAMSALVTAEQSVAAAKRSVEAAKNMPDEPPVGSIVMFDVQYNYGTQVYTYVCFRIENMGWFMTGKSNPFSWKKVVETAGRDVHVKNGERELRLWTGTRDDLA